MKAMFIVACLLVSICLLTASSSYADAAKSIDTASQAEKLARATFRLLGWPATGALNVKAPAANSTVRIRRWRVIFGDYEAHYNADNGQLMAVLLKNALRGRTQANINIDEKTANAKALHYLKLLSLDISNTRIISSKAENYTLNPGTTTWEISMHRYYQDFEFYRDSIHVSLDPRDGSLCLIGDTAPL